MLRTNTQTDGQTDKQMDSKILPTPTDIVDVGNDIDFLSVTWREEILTVFKFIKFTLSIHARKKMQEMEKIPTSCCLTERVWD